MLMLMLMLMLALCVPTLFTRYRWRQKEVLGLRKPKGLSSGSVLSLNLRTVAHKTYSLLMLMA
jgi:hypothetical protein